MNTCSHYYETVNNKERIIGNYLTQKRFSLFSIFMGSFLPDGLNLISDIIIAPAIMPKSTERKMTIASDASNFQKNNVMVTGIAF